MKWSIPYKSAVLSRLTLVIFTFLLNICVSLQLHAKLEKHGLPDHKLRWIETDGQTFHKEQQSKKEEGIIFCFFPK